MHVVDARDPHAPTALVPRAVTDDLVHDVIALAHDLRRHLAAGLRRHRDLRPGFTALVGAVPPQGIAQGALASALGRPVQTMSSAVGLAEATGFVRRVPNPDDGRSKLVVLTDRGRRVAARRDEVLAERLRHHEAHLGAARVIRFVDALTDLRRAEPGAPPPQGRHLGIVVPVADGAVHELHRAVLAAGFPELRRAHTAVLLRVGPDGARASELARELRITRQSASATLHELEELGHLRRSDEPGDRRAVVFECTARGRRFVAAYAAGVAAVERRWAEVLGARRIAELRDDAHDLRAGLRVGTDHATAHAGRPTTARELDDLADELVERLGRADARRLARVLAARTGHEAPDLTSNTNERRTAP